MGLSRSRIPGVPRSRPLLDLWRLSSLRPEEHELMSTSLGHQQLMNGVYRRQRHIYDITRRSFLLGRDPMIAGLAVPQGGSVLEIGCGTGRNLIEIHRRYPHACLYGIDISHEMLTTTG